MMILLRGLQVLLIVGLPAAFLGEGMLSVPRYALIVAALAALTFADARALALARSRRESVAIRHFAAGVHALMMGWVMWTLSQWGFGASLRSANVLWLLLFCFFSYLVGWYQAGLVGAAIDVNGSGSVVQRSR